MNKNNQVDKPVSLIKEEFTAELINLCNNTTLPLFVVEYILKDLIQEIHLITRRQLEADKKQYKDKLNGNFENS